MQGLPPTRGEAAVEGRAAAARASSLVGDGWHCGVRAPAFACGLWPCGVAGAALAILCVPPYVRRVCGATRCVTPLAFFVGGASTVVHFKGKGGSLRCLFPLRPGCARVAPPYRIPARDCRADTRLAAAGTGTRADGCGESQHETVHSTGGEHWKQAGSPGRQSKKVSTTYGLK